MWVGDLPMKKGERFINFRPFLFLMIGVAVGIGAGYFIKFKSLVASVIYCTGALSCLGIIIFFLRKYAVKKRYLIFIPILLAFSIFSCFLVIGKVNSFYNAKIEEKLYTVEGVIDRIEETSSGNVIILEDLTFRCDKDFKSKYKLSLSVGADTEYVSGYKISTTVVVFNIPVIYENSPSVSNINDKIRYQAKVSSLKDISVLEATPTIFGYTYKLIDNTLREGLSGNEYAISLAMLTGNSSKIETRLLNSFRYAGVAHIFAVSGLHIGVIAGALGLLLKIFPKGRRKYFSPIIVLFCVFYSGICGFSSSSIRAVIMFSTMTIVALMWERYDALSSLSIAGFFTLLFVPFEMFSAGFLLSYSAAGFIIVLSGPFTRVLYFLPNKLSQSLAVATGAFLGGLPICITFFGYTSIISVIFNVIFLPLVSVLFVWIFAFVMLGILFGGASVTLIPAGWVLSLIIKLFKFVDFGLFTFSVDDFALTSIAYYVALIVVGGLLNFKRVTKVIITLCLACVFVGGMFVQHIVNQRTLTVISTAKNGIFATLISSEDGNVLIVNGITENYHQGDFYVNSKLYKVSTLNAIIFLVPNEVPDDFIKGLKTRVKVSQLYVYNTEDPYCYGVPIKDFATTDLEIGAIKISPVPHGLGAVCEYGKNTFVFYSRLPQESVGYYVPNGAFDYISAINCRDKLQVLHATKVCEYGCADKINGYKNGGSVIFEVVR